MRLGDAPSRLVVVLCALAGVVSLGCGEEGAASGDAGKGAPESTASRTDSNRSVKLNVFRRPRSKAVRRGGYLAKQSAIPGERYELARRVLFPGTVGAMYIWPATDAVCYSHRAGAGCAVSERFEREGVAPAITRGGVVPPGFTRVYGVARNGVRSIVIELMDGRERLMKVRGNMFLGDVRGVPLTVRGRGPASTQEVAVFRGARGMRRTR